ncbi:cation diffusion facilitator family transporter [Bacillus ectoiniformans]|uniref:cation diffusion facilitator family transporter n=1 Tax=Bacillus ectoiniformans TaxID=1494429 RepID=UPI00195DFC12|nr:cation diffusion facilitator family transporter [Bacillus ectoiniformans]MBM7648237.1 cation diffusion facilitator family transporter [Bacillus ectoiniformans]
MERYEEMKRGEKGAWISIIAYISLSCIKLAAGYIGHSKALQADGFNNTTDVIASIAILIGLKIAQRPPDEDHHYGHFRAETIASLIAAFIMISVGFQVMLEAGRSFLVAEKNVPDLMTAWVALFSAGVMYLVYRYNIKLSKEIHSQSIKAAAEDNKSDALVSIGAFVGIMGSQFGLQWLDLIAALIVGLIIIKTAWDIFMQASHSLTDGFDQHLLMEIKETIRQIPGVLAVRDVKARSHGTHTLVDAVICVKADLNVIESHKITEDIEEALFNQFQIEHTHVHIEPIEE